MIEALAELEHKQWSGWMEYLFSKCTEEERTDGKGDFKTGNLLIPKWAVERWKRQMDTPYHELIDTEKNSDREWAQKVLDIIQNYKPIEKVEPEPPKEPIFPMAMSNLADRGVFALEYMLHGIENTKIGELLADGIEFCEELQRTYEEQEPKEKWTPETVLNRLALYQSRKYTVTEDDEPEIREIQHFFNEKSEPYFIEGRKRMRPKRRT